MPPCQGDSLRMPPSSSTQPPTPTQSSASAQDEYCGYMDAWKTRNTQHGTTTCTNGTRRTTPLTPIAQSYHQQYAKYACSLQCPIPMQPTLFRKQPSVHNAHTQLHGSCIRDGVAFKRNRAQEAEALRKDGHTLFTTRHCLLQLPWSPPAPRGALSA